MAQIKNIIRGFIICMSMYSIIPMPRIEWDEESIKYVMCFLPIVGGIIGVCMVGMHEILQGFTILFQVIFLLLVPVLISGGIHIDGWIDTWDAYFSYGDREKKLEILKDPRTGAFGVLGAIVYFLGLLAVYYQILSNEETYLVALPLVFILSRSLGALCMILMPNAKRDGLGASFANASAQKIVCGVLGVWVCISMVALWRIDGRFCMMIFGIIVVFLSSILSVFYKKFGGISGDLTGCIITSFELLLPFGMAMGGVLL